jgi:Rieske Fe-S protein
MHPDKRPAATKRIDRRTWFMRLALAFDSIVGMLLAVPIMKFVWSPAAAVTRDEGAWLSLGPLGRYPVGETRLATFRHPSVAPTDGQTAGVACWVRRVDEDRFQVFAVNCAHLGCPVRWFSQSKLFMCPCHGGVYYADGARASGPPERGLFEYPHRIGEGELLVQAIDMPTPGLSAARARKQPPCA